MGVLIVSFHIAGNSILHSAADSVTSAVQKASQALNERGERLGRAEEKTEELKNSAQQFAETAHKVRFWWYEALSRSVTRSFIVRGGSSGKNCSRSLFTNSLLFFLMFFLTWQFSGLQFRSIGLRFAALPLELKLPIFTFLNHISNPSSRYCLELFPILCAAV